MIHRDGWLQIKTRIDNKGFTAQIKQIENKLNDLKATLQMASQDKTLFSKREITDMEAEVEKLTSKLDTLKKKQLEIDSNGLSNIKGGIKNINSSISDTIKKVGKLALAVFGVRSAYLAVRKAASTLAQYNEQISADLEYIKFAMASALQPVVEKLISMVFTLLSYINMIAKAWFNVDLFANSSAKSMKKASKSASDMKKSLLGFDDINQLQDNNSSDSSGGSIAPSVDLSNWQGEVPEWLQWIIDNKDVLISVLAGITAGLIAMKLLGLDPIMSLGIGLIIAGIILLVQGIIDFIKDPSWENFSKILMGLAIILAGVAIAMLAVNAANPVAWIILAIAAIVALVAVIIKYWEPIKEWILKMASWINEHVIQPVVKFFVGLWDSITNGVSSAWNWVINILSTVGNWIYSKIIKPVADFFTGLWNGIVNGVNSAMQKVKNIFNSVVSFFRNAVSTIVSLFRNIGTRVGDAIGGAFKTVINGILYAIERILNSPIRAVNRMLDTINRIPGINIARLSTFSLPRLASGGIVDIPKTGLNIGSAIVGEKGPEAVIPLSDDTLQRLANMIPITIDLTNTIDGRVLNRRLETIRANNNFARNGG